MKIDDGANILLYIYIKSCNKYKLRRYKLENTSWSQLEERVLKGTRKKWKGWKVFIARQYSLKLLTKRMIRIDEENCCCGDHYITGVEKKVVKI